MIQVLIGLCYGYRNWPPKRAKIEKKSFELKYGGLTGNLTWSTIKNQKYIFMNDTLNDISNVTDSVFAIF